MGRCTGLALAAMALGGAAYGDGGAAERATQAVVAPPAEGSGLPLGARLYAPWESEGAVVLRLPETLNTGHGLLYIDHERADMPPLFAGPSEVEWVEDDEGGLGYAIELPNGITYGGRLIPREDRVELEFVVRNESGADTFVSAQFCLVLSDSAEFCDREYERTFVHTADGWVRAAEGDRGPMDPQWCLYRLEGGPAPEQQPDPTLWGISTEVPDIGLIAVMAPDGDRVLGYAWERPGFLMNNARIPCIHADPVWPPVPNGEAATVRGVVYFLEGGLDALLERYRADFPDGARR